MARTIFFNDNANRAYPLVLGTVLAMPNATLVDYGGLMGINSDYREATDSTWLHAATRQGDDFVFRFRSDAPGLTAHELVFIFSLSDERYTCQFADARIIEAETHSFSLSVSESLEGCVDDAIWSGYLVIGNLQPLAEILADGQTLEDGATVEPALTRSLVKAYVRSISLANDDRTRATNPAQCRAMEDPNSSGQTHAQATCLLGHVRFQAGYNCKISQDVANNAILIGAMDPTVEATYAGQPCEEVPLFSGETPPTGRSRLDGALDCSEVFRSINGLGGPRVNILSGNGVNLTFDTASHHIIVDVNMHNMAVCSAMGPDSIVDDNECSFSESYADECGAVS